MATRQEIYEAKTLEQLKALGRRDGYAEGWALKVHESRKKPKN